MSVKYFTRAELEEHDIDHERQWIMIDNKILDITDFQFSHPGGDEILLEHAGADATDSFNSIGHSADARRELDDYVIGELHPDERQKDGATVAAASSSSTSSSGGLFTYHDSIKMTHKEPCSPLSQLISKSFNNEQYSDLKVVFPQSNRVLHLHRIIVCEASEFFKTCLSVDMKESNEGGIVTMSEDDNEELMTAILKACYSFEIELPNDDDGDIDKTRIVPLIQLAQKYRFTSLVPTLVSYMVKNIDVKSNALQCFQLDLDNDEQLKPLRDKLGIVLQNSSVKILEGNSYLTLSFDLWRNVLQSIVNRENRLVAYDAIYAWIAHDVQHRNVHACDLLQIVNAVSGKQQQPDAPSNSFDPGYCGTGGTLSNRNTRIKKDEHSGWTCAAMGAKECREFSVRFINHCQFLMIGLAPKSSMFNREGKNFDTNTSGVWYLYCSSGGLYSYFFQNQRYTNQVCCTNGTVVGVKVNENGEMSFSVNGEDRGVAFSGVPTSGLYPAFDMCQPGCEFEFV